MNQTLPARLVRAAVARTEGSVGLFVHAAPGNRWDAWVGEGVVAEKGRVSALWKMKMRCV